jgi:hypothetical protein
MNTAYQSKCALIHKQGICYQCVELDGFYNSGRENPLAGTQGELSDRLKVLHESRSLPNSRWARMLSELLDEVA